MARAIGWDVAVIDDGGDPEEHPVPEVVRTELDLSGLGVGPSTAIVVATQGHYDDLALRAALGTDAGYVGFLQADYELVQGLHVIATGELLDEGQAISTTAPATPGSGEPRFGVWGSLDWFFFRQFEARVDFIQRQNDPFTILGQVHFYL